MNLFKLSLAMTRQVQYKQFLRVFCLPKRASMAAADRLKIIVKQDLKGV